MRADEILKAWTGRADDRVILDYESRHRRRILLKSEGGTEFLLDLPEVPDLQSGDAIRLSTGQIIAIDAAPEELMEIRCHDPLHLARIAWHIGNRHLAAEISASALRIRADHVIAEMMRGLGGHVTQIHAPFNPEGGAYNSAIPVKSHHHHHHA